MGLVARKPRRLEGHICVPPGVLERWRQNIGTGSLWRCDDCGATWTLRYRHFGDYGTHMWDRADDGGGR